MRQPTGKVEKTSTGADLVIERRFKGTLEEVWESVTNSESTARWIGPWRGEPGVGKTVVLTMSFEDGAPDDEMRIEACDPPHHLAVRSFGQYAVFLEVTLKEVAAGEVLMHFVHHVDQPEMVGDYGAGWEYYLDRLVASRDDSPMPTFDEYYPGQKAYFTNQLE
ncbi:MAG: SRPBCC family protein [Polyangiaceae bacterium]|nr:SRPBCC family protein [Myxococcales bacterium]MCB9587885.1 SRPBCC family protein [Polyangiaceae bacterium]MCB9608834.1 SRPBCC family protein [Polyangiaceae bacterium]